MVSKKGTLLENGIVEYKEYAWNILFWVKSGLKYLMEAIIENIGEMPTTDVYLAVRESCGTSCLFQEGVEEKVEQIPLYLDELSVCPSDCTSISKEIGNVLKIPVENLFIHPAYAGTDVVFLIIMTEDYRKYIGLRYFYERFSISAEETLLLKKHHANYLDSHKLADESVRFIYTDCIDYSQGKQIPTFSLITQLSSMTYETSQCNARLVCTDIAEKLTIRLSEPVVFNRYSLRGVRKLLEIAGDKLVAVLRWHTPPEQISPLFEIVGFSEVGQYRKCPQFRINGYLNWTLFDGEKELLNFSQGRYVVKRADKFDRKKVLCCLSKVFAMGCDSLVEVVDKAWNQTHGTLLIISDEIEAETQRLCGQNRGYKVEKLDLSANKSLITSITSIDGAVMLDKSGICHGLGVILDGECVVKGNPSRGARFNSAYNYIAARKMAGQRAVAIVISEDRTMDVITTLDKFELETPKPSDSSISLLSNSEKMTEKERSGLSD